MLAAWKKLQLLQETKNPWWTYRIEEFELASGVKGRYHYVHTNGSSLTIPLLDDGRVALVRQYRYLCKRESLEFPCGSVKDGSTYTVKLQKRSSLKKQDSGQKNLSRWENSIPTTV